MFRCFFTGFLRWQTSQVLYVTSLSSVTFKDLPLHVTRATCHCLTSNDRRARVHWCSALATGHSARTPSVHYCRKSLQALWSTHSQRAVFGHTSVCRGPPLAPASGTRESLVSGFFNVMEFSHYVAERATRDSPVSTRGCGRDQPLTTPWQPIHGKTVFLL